MNSSPGDSGLTTAAILRTILLLGSLCGWQTSSVWGDETAPRVSAAESPAATLAALVEQPTLARLRRLLNASEIDESEPVSLLASDRPRPDKIGGPVWRIATDTGVLTVVTAKARPRRLTVSPDQARNVPEAAYLFDESGKLIEQFGGDYSLTDSPENVEIVNLGPQEDWFIRVTRFDKQPPFNFCTDYYRIAAKPIQSLRHFHYPNSNPWSDGPYPEVRYGTLYFKLTGLDPPERCGGVLGKSENNVLMPREIAWDGNHNRFRGAVTQTVNDRVAYLVDTEWSREFEPLDRKANQLLAVGGARGRDAFYDWQILVPADTSATVTLTMPDPADNATAKSITRTLRPGLHMVSLTVKPDVKAGHTDLKLYIGEMHEEFRVAAVPTDDPPEATPVIQVLDPAKTARLIEVTLAPSDRHISLKVGLP